MMPRAIKAPTVPGPIKAPVRTGTPIRSWPVEREGSVEVIGSPKAPPRAADPTHLLRLSRLSSCSWSLSESLTGDGAAIFHHACGLGFDWSYPPHAGQKETPAADPQATGLSEGIISATIGSRQLTSY